MYVINVQCLFMQLKYKGNPLHRHPLRTARLESSKTETQIKRDSASYHQTELTATPDAFTNRPGQSGTRSAHQSRGFTSPELCTLGS